MATKEEMLAIIGQTIIKQSVIASAAQESSALLTSLELMIADTTQPPPAPTLPAPAMLTGEWRADIAGGAVLLSAMPVTGAARYGLHRSADGDTTTDIDAGPPHTTAASPSFTDPIPQTIRVQSYRYCVSAIDAAGVRGECSEDITVTVPAAVVPPPPPPPPPSNVKPTAVATADRTSGVVPLLVQFSGGASQDTDGNIVAYDWQFGDGTNSISANPSKAYAAAGVYAVTLRVRDNQGAVSDPASLMIMASETLPPPPPTPNPTGQIMPPTNLRVRGIWQDGGPTDVLEWDSAPGQVGTDIYQYELKINGAPVTGNRFSVPRDKWYDGLTYTAVARDATGMESLPSNMVRAQKVPDPNGGGVAIDAPSVPRNLTAKSEWNAGKPRNVIAWELPTIASHTCSVYRDGVLLASGLWCLFYIDNAPTAGATHSYRVSGSNVPKTPVESPQSAPVSVRTASAPPALSSSPVSIVRQTPNDDSAIVEFAAVAGAVDYRAASPAKPGVYKYSGGGLKIEINGLLPSTETPFVIEALDKFGPFQRMESMTAPPPGAMQMDGTMRMEINGHGDPSNVPNVIARSAAVQVRTVAREFPGEQVFFDTFRGSAPFVQKPVDNEIARIVAGSNGADLNNLFIREFQNDKWIVRNYDGDVLHTKIFTMSNHFMDTFFDGGTARTNTPAHESNAGLVMIPKAANGSGAPHVVDISGGKCLHVTMEVDAFFTGRRWWNIELFPAGEKLLRVRDVGSLLHTPSGRGLVWEILHDKHNLTVSTGVNAGGAPIVSSVTGPVLRKGSPPPGRSELLNGSEKDIDLRHRFDLYVTRDRARLVEDGVVVFDGPLPAPLPFDQVSVGYVHEVYHTGTERADQILIFPQNVYIINFSPYFHTSHLDGMGCRRMAAIP